MSTKLKAAFVAVAAFAAIGSTAALPANAAQAPTAGRGAATTQASPDQHQYNPDAPLGSADNPIIIGDQSLALLNATQRKALDDAKIAGEKAARSNKGKAPSSVVQPATTYGCLIGVYWSQCNSISWGWWDLATLLGTDYHEYATVSGFASNGHDWQDYMDVSRDGGSTWTGRVHVMTDTTEASATTYDGPGYYVRGCLYDMQAGLVVCGGWH